MSETTLGEVCAAGGGFIRTGPFGSQLHQSDYIADPDGIPVVMPKDMSDGRVDVSSIARISPETADRLSDHLLTPGDIVLARRGDVGRTAWIEADELPLLCGTGSMRIHPGDDGPILPDYLRYFMRSRLAVDYLEAQAVGATMPNLNADIVAGLPITVPPKDQQARAAAALRTLDGLIENNRRRIELLEEMAQAIYREWFVRFRYPGHEADTFVDSPFGLIPESWRLAPLGELVTVDKGLSYKGAHLTKVGVPMVNLKCIRPGGGFRRDGTKPYSGPFQSKHTISAGDIVAANTDLTQAGNVIGSPALVPRKGFESGGMISHHLFAVRCSDPRRRLFIYGLLSEERFRSYARSVASGTTVLGFRSADLCNYEFVCPPVVLTERFSELMTPAFVETEALSENVEVLANIRDLLLPKLVTGKIDISKLDLDALVDKAS